MFLLQINAGFTSYAGDNKPNCLCKSLEEVITKLKQSSRTIFKWFEDSDMKWKPDKCHMLMSKKRSFAANTVENKISNTKTKKLLRVTSHHPLTLDDHISKLCKKKKTKKNNKLHPPAIGPSYLDQDINSYFWYQLTTNSYMGEP